VQLLFALGLMIGVAPSTCATALLFTHAAYSAQTMTYNLGPMLLVPIFGMLALLDRGRLSCWARQRPAAPAIQYRLAHFIVFLAFAAWSFAALLNHIRGPFWMEGRTVAAMFSSSYLSEYYGLFRAWELAGPRSYYAVSIVVVCGQTLFQAAMLPLIVVFILGSLGDLQLSVLPLVEVVMWLAVFAPSRWFTWSVRSARSSFAEDSPWRGRALAMYISTFTALFVLFLADAVVPALTQRRLPAWIGQSLIYTGLAAPNVFNRVDLKMGDSWAILDRMHGNQLERVPFNGPDGDRLEYHRGDLIYFVNSIRWRRSMIDLADYAAFHRPGAPGYEYARKIALYDYRRAGGSGEYIVTVYRNRASEHSVDADPRRFTPVRVFEFTLDVGTRTAEGPGSR
jgi:hypothetical protein